MRNALRSCWGTLVVGAALLGCGLLGTGCSNEVATPPSGSWVEILELEQADDAVDVESLPSFRSVEVLLDRLVFRFDGASPLVVGNVVAGDTTDGYLRRILSITELPDGSIEAMTRRAALPEYYPKLHVIFHYRPVRVDEPTIADLPGVATAALGGGCEDTTPCDITGGRSWGSDTAGCSAEYGAGLEIGPFVETDLTADFEFDHGIDIDGPRVWPPRIASVSFEPDAYFVIDGSIRTGVRMSGTASAQIGCDADFAALLGGGAAPEVTLAVVAVGPIPITLSAVPILAGTFSAAADVGEFSAEAGASASAAMEFGFRDGDAHVAGPDFAFDSFAEVTTARAGALSASGSIEAGLQLRLQIGYDFSVGPADVDLGVVGTVDITGTLGADFTADTGGCAWNVDIPWSCNVAFGIGVEMEAEAFEAGFDWSQEHDWPAIELASGSLGSLGGALPWCGGTSTMCDEAARSCIDELLDNGVCDGMMGFQACADGQFQRCTCTGGGWTACGACMSL
ncbi:MAG: hypothetical protein M3Y87_15780 [Myxococcota bacterium]|nr:hypothetical protein [Myxococcota bacterium]